LFYNSSVGAVEDGATTALSLWGLMGGLEATFVIFFATFIVMINKKYVGTFFSTQTAKQYKQRHYQSALTDRAKCEIFLSHPSYYASFRSEIAFWVRENWDIWNEERPEWFTERVKSSIPNDMIPVNEEVARNCSSQ
jgi:hypothetical protein